MTPETFLDGRVTLHAGDNRAALKALADNSIDAVVTDPPYALVSIGKRFGKPGAKNSSKDAYKRASAGFMGKSWDTGEVAFATEFWAEVYRVLKPGGYVLAASATRTYHRLAVAIEDAGFEIRDMVSWLYGSGFPKSHDVSKAIDKAKGCERAKVRIPVAAVGNLKARQDSRPFIEAAMERGYHEAVSDEAVFWQGWGTALKPACEPWVMARKPLIGTVAENVLAHGTGALNIDGCRVDADEGRPARVSDPKSTANGAVYSGRQVAGSGFDGGSRAVGITKEGRWPANVVHDGSDEVEAAFPVAPGQQGAVTGREPSSPFANVYGDMPSRAGGAIPRADSGSAARFFYSAKADAEDRLGSKHPTVKPVDLMQYFCRLVTPPAKAGSDGVLVYPVILDPFAGTGTTGEAAWREGFSAILMEREADYQEDIRRRMRLAAEGPATRARESLKANGRASDDAGPLFGGLDAPHRGAGGSTATSPTRANDRPDRAQVVSER